MRGLALTAVTLLTLPLLAQHTDPAPIDRVQHVARLQQPPPDGGTTEVLQSIFIPPLPDAPFTLTLATEWVRPLGTDGNTVTLTNERHIARDHAGRVYQERVLLAPPGIPLEGRTNLLQLADPATHSYLNCFLTARRCNKLPYNAPLAPPDLSVGTSKLKGATEQRTDMGRNVIEGVEVTGIRVATTIDAGQFGNAKPVTFVREFWYSPALGINLRSSRDDPRFGKQTFTVTALTRGEPDPALWNVPADFAVADESSGNP